METNTVNIIANTLVSLPFALDFCAQGPDVEPITVTRDDVEVTLYLPPSMSDGTVGKSVFPSGWAWWTGTRLRLELSLPTSADQLDAVEEARGALLSAANDVLRRFLNDYRVRFARPDVFPIALAPKDLTLELEHDDGRREALPEPFADFFYQSIPQDAPLTSSVNATNREQIQVALQERREPRVEDQWLLDIVRLRHLGDDARADALEQWRKEHETA